MKARAVKHVASVLKLYGEPVKQKIYSIIELVDSICRDGPDMPIYVQCNTTHKTVKTQLR